MARHYMNPFEFVPLPSRPQKLPPEILNEPRCEGVLEYSLKVLTPLHISGKITSRNPGSGNSDKMLQYQRKLFFRPRENGPMVIPGSSVRGMLAAFIEALTGSDFGVLTVGDEAGLEKYAKKKGKRHVGFKFRAADHPAIKAEDEAQETQNREKDRGPLAYKPSSFKYECNITLPNGFGQRNEQRIDIARFMFGFVGEAGKKEENAPAEKGRLVFEDIEVPLEVCPGFVNALDVRGKAAMGAPNPRANTAWYFNPGEIREHSRGFDILADKVRGRKFYFHQDPERCIDEYFENWISREENKKRGKLYKYKVECLTPQSKAITGRIYFTDLPLSLLKLVCEALTLQFGESEKQEKYLAHKLGSLKAFGYGSVQFEIQNIRYRSQKDVFSNLQGLEDYDLKTELRDSLIDKRALKWLKKILHFPQDEEEEKKHLFLYPPYWNKNGFAQVQKDEPKRGVNEIPKEFFERLKKKTLYFDLYQQNATNFKAIMEKKLSENQNFVYSHKPSKKE